MNFQRMVANMDQYLLKGLRVLDLTRNVAGPFATMILGDLGAEIIKIEHPQMGDDTRHWGPPFYEGAAPSFLELNRNKLSLTLDLASPKANDIMTQLVQSADVLVESFRPGALETLGFGVEWARQINPGLIYCSVTSYGNVGPLRDRPGYDPLLQAFGGVMSVTGESDRPPVRVGFSSIDMGTGMWAAMAVLGALYRRTETQQGEHIVTSLYETALSWMRLPLSGYRVGGQVPDRHGSGIGGIVPYRAYPTCDGYLVIAAGNDNLFRRLCAVLGHTEWADDERFSTNPTRVQNRVAIDALITESARCWTTAELESVLRERGVPCSPIRTLDVVADDEQADALGIFHATTEGPFAGSLVVGLPMTLGGKRPLPVRSAPKLGEQTADILASLDLPYDDVGSEEKHGGRKG